MRGFLILILSAVTLGLAGGYAWSVMATPSAKAAKLPKETTIAIPASPEERPEALDQEWTARAQDQSAPSATAAVPSDSSVHYSGCNEVRAADKAPLYEGQPGYRADMDGDGDGVACEPHPGA
jgi:hypothetical protein